MGCDVRVMAGDAEIELIELHGHWIGNSDECLLLINHIDKLL